MRDYRPRDRGVSAPWQHPVTIIGRSAAPWGVETTAPTLPTPRRSLTFRAGWTIPGERPRGDRNSYRADAIAIRPLRSQSGAEVIWRIDWVRRGVNLEPG